MYFWFQSVRFRRETDWTSKNNNKKNPPANSKSNLSICSFYKMFDFGNCWWSNQDTGRQNVHTVPTTVRKGKFYLWISKPFFRKSLRWASCHTQTLLSVTHIWLHTICKALHHTTTPSSAASKHTASKAPGLTYHVSKLSEETKAVDH